MFRVYGKVDNQLFSAWKDEKQEDFFVNWAHQSRGPGRGGGGGWYPGGWVTLRFFHQYFNQITA